MSAPPPPARGGLSLYANLLETSNSTPTSEQSTQFQPEGSAQDAPARRPIDPALRFQPIRRPQVKQPNKPKPSFPKAPPATSAGAVVPAPQQRSTLADWTATEDDEFAFNGGGGGGGGAGGKRQRGGRRKKKKVDDGPVETNWDELYDPSRPTNVEEYLHSEERIREIREWKAVLYAHRRQRRRGTSRGTSDDESRGSEEEDVGRAMPNQFAPPASLSFAPPPEPSSSTHPIPADTDTTGDSAYARRLALSNTTAAVMPPPSPPQATPAPLPPADHQPPPPPPPQQPVPSTATISRAPVRYEPAPAGDEEDAMDIDNPSSPSPPTTTTAPAPSSPPRTSRPGQAGFAQRLMSKYGWTKGSGLGADEGGITSALRVQVEKRRKRPDAEGGGFAEPGGRGKIVGGGGAAAKKRKQSGDDEGLGTMSEVIVLRNMLEGMPDLEAEIEAGIGQEIGEECGEKYGRVERLFIDVGGRQVFIKFVEKVSALRAVNALQNRIFNGNAITARFFDTDKFEQGIYT
ncbi:hypothetical protein B0T22DRAFT_308561 [Podospora appendiculata]|uniref:G-patch domain-containing protein n=1 Tax=Podospora appendiculata TaxID=314037 RepID=A0AAE0WZR4_9PEZI|nr:hypothetical protein B0T22DRAFT_308561 [Podospora appendiculata]